MCIFVKDIIYIANKERIIRKRGRNNKITKNLKNIIINNNKIVKYRYHCLYK